MHLFALAFFLTATQALAWDHHQAILAQMMDTQSASSRAYLKSVITVPSEEEQKKTLALLARDLEVNVEKIPIQKPGKILVRDFLTDEENYTSIDEPDFGMDQDLPDSTDPHGDRAWMGGKTGPTSQGYRHMYFQGIEWSSPIRTLQIPLHSVGQSPERILKIHAISQKFLQEKNTYWALRTLLWELHLVQDLHQPFHTMQVPYIRMLPWKDLFRKFVARSTQVVANFHYAYEGLVLESLKEERLSVLAPCFEVPDHLSLSPMNEAMVKDTVELSRSKAHEIGVPLYELWNSDAKDPIISLPDGMGAIDYYSYLHANADEANQKEKVEWVNTVMKTTCDLMKHVSMLTFSELDQLFKN